MGKYTVRPMDPLVSRICFPHWESSKVGKGRSAGRQIRMNPMDFSCAKKLTRFLPNWDFSTNIFCRQEKISVLFLFLVFGPSIFSGGFDDFCNFPISSFHWNFVLLYAENSNLNGPPTMVSGTIPFEGDCLSQGLQNDTTCLYFQLRPRLMQRWFFSAVFSGDYHIICN